MAFVATETALSDKLLPQLWNQPPAFPGVPSAVWLVLPIAHFGNGVHTHIYAGLLSKTASALSFARYKQQMVQPVLPSPLTWSPERAAKSLRMLCLLVYEKIGLGGFTCTSRCK